MTSLKFEKLLSAAIREWPSFFDVIDCQVDADGRFHFPSIWPYPHNIVEAHLGANDEVLVRHLHEAIGQAVRGAAKHVTCVRLSELRPLTIQQYFEIALRERITPECGWEPRDFELINEYFSANKPAEEG